MNDSFACDQQSIAGNPPATSGIRTIGSKNQLLRPQEVNLWSIPSQCYRTSVLSEYAHPSSRLGRETVKRIEAIRLISKMRGGTRSQLVLGGDQGLWVVKFKHNPQHIRVLANELIATRVASEIGLSVPAAALMYVSDRLIDCSPQHETDAQFTDREKCSSGFHFGSKFAGGLMPGQVVDYLPEGHLQNIRNLEQFAGILAFDKWSGNIDGRQAVFKRTSRERDYTAVFIDQGFCFGGGDWSFRDSPLQGIFPRNTVYSKVTGWSSFEPWLTRIEEFSPQALWNIAKIVPPEWYDDDQFRIEKLLETMLRRKSRVRELIDQFRLSDRTPFPNWKETYTRRATPCFLFEEDGKRVRWTQSRQ